MDEAMATTVNMHQAKTHLSRLVEQVQAGDEVVIARAGRPVARLIKFEARTSPRNSGVWRGRVRLRADFDLPDQTIIDTFDG